jgi:hypothetical protein
VPALAADRRACLDGARPGGRERTEKYAEGMADEAEAALELDVVAMLADMGPPDDVPIAPDGTRLDAPGKASPTSSRSTPLATKNPAAEKMATIQHYLADPDVRKAAWRSRNENPAFRASPNTGHQAIVELARQAAPPGSTSTDRSMR